MKAKKLMSMLLAATMVCSSPLSVLAGSEMEDTDLARSAAVVADCPVHQSGKYNVGPVKDGDDTTGWLSEAYTTSQHTKHWVYLDFGKPMTFDRIKLVWDAEKYAEDYKIQMSDTARDSDWYDCVEETGNTSGGVKEYEIEPTTARYVRVYTTKNVTEDETIQLNTFSVFQTGEDLDEETAVSKDEEWLTEDVVRTATGLYPEITNPDLKNVKSSLNLPKNGFASSDISWSVAPEDGNINLDTGEVIRSDADKDYTLTATITKGEISREKKFDVTVKANVELGSRIVEMEDRSYLELDGSPFLYVTVQNCGTQQLKGHGALSNGLSSFKETKAQRAKFEELYGDVDEIPLSYLENMFEKMHDLGYKHMGIIFKWRDWEPEEAGVYDWTVVDQYIEWCDKYDMSWDIVYFGSNSCGGTRLTNGNVCREQWWMRNVPDYLDKHDGYWHNGDYVGENHCPVLKGENYEYIKGNEIRAIQDLMDHIAEVDKNHRTATFQVMNEPDWHTRYNTEDKRWVQEWISDVAVAIKASDYSLVTRINGGYGMPHADYIPITKLPGVDMAGDDAYTTSVDSIRDIFQKDLYDAGFPHIAENDGSFSNTSSLVLTTLLYGGGYHGWQFNDHWWDQGMADTAANGPYYTWKLGTPVKWRESGQDMSRLNPSMNKIADKLACAPLASMAGLNIETNSPAKNYSKLKMVDGIYAGYECNDASVALALKDGNDIYLVSDSASSGDGSVNFLSYQEIISASYVGYYKDEVGVADADKEWVEEEPVEVVRGSDGIYRVPVKAGQALKVTFGESTLSTMKELSTSAGALTPDFDPNTHEYTMTVGAETSQISFNAVLSEEDARYTVKGRSYNSGVSSRNIPLQFGENKIEVKVVWEGFPAEITDNTYTIRVNRSEMSFDSGIYENVARKKNVSSPNYSGGWWHAIGNAVDGNLSTIAQPASPSPVWNLKVDLGGAYAVDRVKLAAEQVNIPTKFNIKVSVDGENWTTVLTEESFAGGTFDKTFAPQEAAYVLVEALEANTGNDCGWVVKELEVYGVEDGKASELSAAQVASSMLSMPAYNGNGTITYPKVPFGFTVSVEESSNTEIVALDGTVTPGACDETVALRLKVTKDADPEDVAYSRLLPVTITSEKTTPQNINLALNKEVTGSADGSSETLKNIVDGTKATRYEASAAGFPQWVTVDLGSAVEINQIVTTWDASRASEYRIWLSDDGQEWREQGTYTLDREGTVVNDFETTRCRYVKLEALKRGPNTNVFALVELEVYSKMAMPEAFVLQGINLSDGEISPVFDKYVNAYTAIVGKDVTGLTVSPVQTGQDAYTFVNDEKVMSGAESSLIPLETGKNVITVSVQDPDNAANTVSYEIEVTRKDYSVGDYTNVVLNKAVTTPGFEVGYWHPLRQINDGNKSTFAQSSSTAVLDYQFDLAGCFLVDEFEIYTGNNNRPTSFDIKTSLDGTNWTTVLSVDNFDPAVTKYEFEPTYANYVLMDTKTTDGSWTAVNEIIVNGIPAEMNAQVVADSLGDMEIVFNEETISLPNVPEGYTVTIEDSDRTEIIDIDGTVTHTDSYETVKLTLKVENDGDTARKEITVVVQPSQLTNQAVAENIARQIQNPEKDQTRMILPEAPSGFTVTYRADQDGSGIISINGNVMTINPLLSDSSLPLGITVTSEADNKPADVWHTVYFPARSKTAQEIMKDVTLRMENSKVVLSDVPEGYKAEIIATNNTAVVDVAGNVTAPATTTVVEIYVQVTKLSDKSTDMKVFTVTVEGNVDKTAIEAVIALADEKLEEAAKYDPATVEILVDALESAEAFCVAPSTTQSVLDKAKENLQNAIDGLKEKQLEELPYKDVEDTDWFYEDVCTMYEKGLMTGVDAETFAPALNLTRDQFAVILWRAEGSPKMDYEEKFADVAEGQWYTNAVLWANKNGIATGYADSKLFGPADPISREQAAVMLYRYAEYKGYDVTEKAELDDVYDDADAIQGYAKDAMAWAVGAGIIKGKDGQKILAPQGNTNRAESAAVISRFVQKYEK